MPTAFSFLCHLYRPDRAHGRWRVIIDTTPAESTRHTKVTQSKIADMRSGVDVFTVRDGKLLRQDGFDSRAEGLRAAGIETDRAD